MTFRKTLSKILQRKSFNNRYKKLSFVEAKKFLSSRNPENIVKHSIKVHEFAHSLANTLLSKGVVVDVYLASIAALLHDVDKFESLTKGYDYSGNTMILYRRGYRKIAKTILRCQLDNFVKYPLYTFSIEEMIVQYSDKRVLEDRVVTLEKRFDYLYNRYGKISKEVMKKLRKAYNVLKTIEKIFDFLAKRHIKTKI